VAILNPSIGSDRFSLFATATITGSAQSSGAVPMNGVSTAVFEITTDGNNATDATFTIEGTNDPAVAATLSGWLPAEPIADVAGATTSGNLLKANTRTFVHVLPASVAAMTWPTPSGFDWLRLTFTGGSAAGLLTVNLQRVRGNG
jgi:hypothetical protein